MGLEFAELKARDASADALLTRHHALMRSLSPAESCHVQTADALRARGARLFVGRDAAGAVMAIGALAALDTPPGPEAAGELKSMHCHSDLRGQGAGKALLEMILAAAVHSGMTSLWLETGTAPAFAAARRLYETHGFVPCPPFGTYRLDPLSVFMTRAL